MEIQKNISKIVRVAFILLAVLLGMMFTSLIFVSFGTIGDSILGEGEYLSDSETFISHQSTYLSHSDITSLTSTRKNQTWLDFNGINESVSIPSNVTESITFWYKNETSDWFFVANSSGILYVDGITDTPNQYPIYYNETNYILGKENATSFLNVSIDDFRIYNSTLETSLINLIYDGGRI